MRRDVIESQCPCWSAEDWGKWVAEQVQLREEVFSRLPSDMISAYNREEGWARDYHGRELLELLQNADDAGVGTNRPVEVAIVLADFGLCVANTGVTFSPLGVESLMISDNSPKDRSQYIGNRGLGFRSILRWTTCPAILSGNLLLGFDRDYAVQWMERLASRHANVAARIDREHVKVPHAAPVPTLAVPYVLCPGTEASGHRPAVDSWAPTWDRAHQLRAQGYDTIVAIPFTDADAFEDARQQLTSLRKEVLLFTNHIAKLVVVTPTWAEEWRVERTCGSIAITATGATDRETRTWQVSSRTGVIPDEYLQTNQKDTPNFELRVALPDDANGGPGVMFSYFPTEVHFPYPMVVHATLELKNDRAQIAKTEANRFVIEQLAGLLAETADGCRSEEDPWHALSLVSAAEKIDPQLVELGFSQALDQTVRQHPIIPLRHGKWSTPDRAYQLGAKTLDWLPYQEFEDVVLPVPNQAIARALEELGIQHLSRDDLRNRLNRVSRDYPSFSLSDRAQLIAGLLDGKPMPLLPETPAPDLLLEMSAEVIPADEPAYFPPAGSTALQLPSWLRLHVLHPDFVTELRYAYRRTRGSDAGQPSPSGQRQLVAWLKAYQLREYALDTLVSAVVARANDQVHADPNHESQYRQQALAAIFHLYDQSERIEAGAPLKDITVYVPTLEGGWASAGSVYFGRDYACGRLPGALYEDHWPNHIVAPLTALHLTQDMDRAVSFLRWLGVADRPRATRKTATGPHMDKLLDAFTQYALKSISYPASFGDFVASKGDRLGAYVGVVSSFDHLDSILECADPRAVLAWIATDERIDELRRHGDDRAELYAATNQMRSWRQLQKQVVPSYVAWLLGRVRWLPTALGPAAPTQCVLASPLGQQGDQLLRRPTVNPDDSLFGELQIDRTALRVALLRSGVHESLDTLAWDAVYALLLELPQKDPEGRLARTLYRAVINREDTVADAHMPNRQRFLAEGRVWATLDAGEAYYPISQVRYVDTLGVPKAVSSRVPLIAVDRRRGAQKVEKVFGVRTLRPEDVAITVSRSESHPRAADFGNEVQEFKPYALAWRTQELADTRGAAQLRELNVALCATISANARIADMEVAVSLMEPGDYIICNHTAYIVAEQVSLQQTPLLERYLYADVVGEVFAHALGIGSNDGFARLASCPPDARLVMLARWLGVSRMEAEDWVARARSTLHLPPDNPLEDIRSQGDIWAPPPPGDGSPPTEPNPPQHGSDSGQDTNAPHESQPDSSSHEGLIGPVTVTEKPHLPRQPAHSVKLRISRAPTGMQPGSQSRWVVDPARCQELARQFEEAQDRFPLPVDHLQGERGYGCDILSFATSDDRERFIKQPDRKTVDRFIEVKGRASDEGKIELRGNELRAAQQHGPRYYVYRVYEREPGAFDVLTLSDPCAAPADSAVLVDLRRAPATQRWIVAEIPEDASSGR